MSLGRFGPVPPPPDYSPLVLTPAEQAEEDQWYATFRAEWEQAEADFEVEMAELDATMATLYAERAEFEAKMAAYRDALKPTSDAGRSQVSVTPRDAMTPDEFRRRLDLAMTTGTEIACRRCGRNYRPTTTRSPCPKCAIYWNRQPPTGWRDRHTPEANA